MEKIKGKWGRPTKYKKKYIKFAYDYIKDCIDESKIPFIEELATLLYVDENTLNSWGKVHDKENDDFLSAIKKLKDIQKQMLKMGGLSNKTNTAMSIFLLKADHGLKETISVEGIGDESKFDANKLNEKQREDLRRLVTRGRTASR